MLPKVDFGIMKLFLKLFSSFPLNEYGKNL